MTQIYDRVLGALGPELSILGEMPIEDIARADELLGEAVTRLRAGNVIRDAGYDGEYGVIKLFRDGELSRLRGGVLFEGPVARNALLRPLQGEAGRGQLKPQARLATRLLRSRPRPCRAR